ncbi:MAG TPA: metalloregulator ArsR/SmtB family transcription factor [Pseudomonadales bacterium]|nr:metalloregulator ArsR/SmtB family transcription factor [Pseudomonadales bacterium]
MPKAAATPAIDDTLIALADPMRRGIVELLKVQPRRAGEIATLLDASPPLVSKHLKVLRGSALVEEDRTGDDARVRVYRLRPQRLEELRDWLSDVGAFWNDQLASFKAAADAAAGKAPDGPSDSPRKARRTRRPSSPRK